MPAAFPIRWQMDWRLVSDRQRLVVALVASLLLHGLIYGGWKAMPSTTAFIKSVIAPKPLPLKKREAAEFVEPPPPPKREVPMVFVEVDPALASAEPPKDTKNYSTENSLAANPIPAEKDTPKIEGKQSPVLRTMDSAKPEPKPLQPKPPEPAPPDTKEDVAEVKPKTTPPPGDLAQGKSTAPKAPELTPQKDGDKPTATPRSRPRTLQEARARNSALAGQRTQQDGGVRRQRLEAGVDARRSPFGNYDAVFISMVQARWYQLLDNNQYMQDRRGKVVVSFRLHHDGRISQLEMKENTVGDMLSLLCQKSILDPAPFPKWPRDMRQIVGGEHREVKFTFYYD